MLVLFEILVARSSYARMIAGLGISWFVGPIVTFDITVLVDAQVNGVITSDRVVSVASGRHMGLSTSETK